MRKRNKGVLTVEACISFTIFAMVMISMFYIIRIVYVNGVIQHAINQSAKEFSTYSYLYAVSGLADLNDNANAVAASGAEKFDGSVVAVVDAYSSFSDFGNDAFDVKKSTSDSDFENALKGVDQLYTDYNDFKEKFPIAADSIKDMASNPVDYLKSLASVFTKNAADDAKTFLCGEIIRAMCAQYIAASGGSSVSADVRLKSLQVEGGLNGLDFSFSKFFSDDESIDIIVCYKLKDISPIKLLPDLNMINRVKIRAWLGESALSSVSPDNANNTNNAEQGQSIWDQTDDTQRGKALQEQYGYRNLANNFKTFSYFENGVAIATKSIDPREQSYADESKIRGQLVLKLNEMRGFEGDTKNGVTVKPEDISKKKLIIFIPPRNEQHQDIDRSKIDNVVKKLTEEYSDIEIVVMEADIIN